MPEQHTILRRRCQKCCRVREHNRLQITRLGQRWRAWECRTCGVRTIDRQAGPLWRVRQGVLFE